MADINTEDLKGKAQEALDGAGKAAAGAVEAAKPVIDAAVKGVQDAAKAAEPVVTAAAGKVQEAFDTHAKPVIDAAAAKVSPVVDTVGAKASEFAKSTGLDKTIDQVTHDAGVVAQAAKNKVEELTGRDLDGDGKVGSGEGEPGETAAEKTEKAVDAAADKAVEAADALEAKAAEIGAVVEKKAGEAKVAVDGAVKAAGEVATGAKNKIETLLNTDIDGDGKIG